MLLLLQMAIFIFHPAVEAEQGNGNPAQMMAQLQRQIQQQEQELGHPYKDLGEKDATVGPEVGPTSAFYSCINTITHGPTCIFWANLTPFSL
jgi:hypothetical protein